MSDYYTQVAGTLNRLADDFAGLAGRDLADLAITIYVQTRADSDDDKIRTVDAVANTLLDAPGQPRRMSGGGYHHDAHGRYGAVQVSVFDSVTDPQRRDLQAELDRLRAENEHLRGQS